MTQTMMAPSSPPAIAHAGIGHPVLVATSAEDGIAALRAARMLAAQRGTNVVALSVIEPVPTVADDPQFGYFTPEYETIRSHARLAALRAQVASVAGATAPWTMRIRFGPAADAIADEAREQQAALIVMDSGRHGRIARLLLGETTLRTIRWAESPVLAIGKAFDAMPRVAVAAIDFSPSSIAAARTALTLLGDGATLYLLHVWRRGGSGDAAVRARDDEYEQRLPALFERLERVIAAPPSITVRHLSMIGEPVQEILRFASSQGADLLVAGRRGHGFLERLLVGSVTSALVRGAECSVLVTPEPPLVEADALARSVIGAFESRKPDAWNVELEEFTRRNAGRGATLEADDPSTGLHMQATGYVFRGAAYDHNDRRVELMLGNPANATAHFTHTISNVSTIAVRSDPGGKDNALLVVHRAGRALLRFVTSYA